MSEKLAQLPPPQRLSALAVMASRFAVDPAKLLDTLKNTAFKGATDAQMMALCIVANEMGLNPFLREIYAFPDTKSGGIVPVIGVDGWFNRINAHPQYDGLEKEFVFDANHKPVTCTVTIFRKDRRPTKHTEILTECYRNTNHWNERPARMLGHRAIIQCARIAFGFAGGDADEWGEPRVTTGRIIEPFPLGNDSPPVAGHGSAPVSAPVEAAVTSSDPAETTSAGTLVQGSDAHAEGVGGGRAPAPESSPPAASTDRSPDARSGGGEETVSPPRGATPARRTPKPAGPPLELSGENETVYQRLCRNIAEEKLVYIKIGHWLEHNDFPPLAMLSATDAEQVLELFGAMKEECRP